MACVALRAVGGLTACGCALRCGWLGGLWLRFALWVAWRPVVVLRAVGGQMACGGASRCGWPDGLWLRFVLWVA